MRRPDHHNEVELNFLEAGTVTYLLGGKKVQLVAGRLSAFWGAIPHQIIAYGNEPAYFVGTIPLPWFLQWRLPRHFVQLLLQGELITEKEDDRAFFDAHLFARWVDDLMTRNAEFERSVLLEMEARLIRLAGSIAAVGPVVATGERGPAASRSGLSKVEQMACFIAEHYTERLTVQRIAELVNLHPNYAMNLFQKAFGATLVDDITNHRVSHAQRLLATTDQKIVDAAYESGFASISRFNDAFRRACGCSPREYRRTHLLPELATPSSP